MALTTSLTIVGNLTNDPELRSTREGKPVVNITMAANPRSFNRDTKEWEDGEPIFYKGVAFGNLAEHIGGSLNKGDRVLAYGTIKTDSWTDKDSGTKRTAHVLQIEEIGASLQFTNVQTVKSAPNSAPAQSQGQSQESWSGSGDFDNTPF